MVFFVSSRGQVLGSFLRTWAARIESRTLLVRYEEALHAGSVPGAKTYVFTDLELLTPKRLWLATVLADQLAAAEGAPRILNHPRRALLRYDLLRMLFERGINPYQAYRVLHTRTPSRFPVFLRFENDHEGPASPLLHNQRELDRELLRAHVRGDDLASLLMVEFQDTSDDQGVFRKFNAFVMGDQLIIGNIAFGTDWVVKYSGRYTDEQLIEKWAYLSSHMHDDSLREFAELAGAGWGRFDYALANGRVCVWEFNTYGTLMLDPEHYPPDVRARRARLAERLTAAIERLAGEDGCALPPVLVARKRSPTFVSPVRALGSRSRAALRRAEPIALLAPRPALWLVRHAGYRRGALPRRKAPLPAATRQGGG